MSIIQKSTVIFITTSLLQRIEKKIIFVILFITILLVTDNYTQKTIVKRNQVYDMQHFTKNTFVTDVMNDKSFQGFGELIFPVDRWIPNNMTLETIDNLYIWYHCMNVDKTVEIVNYMKEQVDSGKQIFYSIYTEEEMKKDPEKRNTGIFYFRGKENSKFAILNAGGGFMYVGAMQDSFPHALELSKHGYNGFALIYRPDVNKAMEDLSRAIAFIHDNKDELKVDTEAYSAWGGSAGGRMAAWLGNYGTEPFIEKKYPRPSVVIMQYSGLSEVSGNEPPTYNCVGTSDGIASYEVMQERINKIKQNGTDAEIEIFNGLLHGFGLGLGTNAEGWINNAIKFWERNIE